MAAEQSPISDEKHSLNSSEAPKHEEAAAAVASAPVVEVTNADLHVALTTGEQLNPRSMAAVRLYLVLLVAFMGSMSNGFDGQVMGAVNGMKYVAFPSIQHALTDLSLVSQYLSDFGISNEDSGGGVGTVVALIFGIYSIGEAKSCIYDTNTV